MPDLGTIHIDVPLTNLSVMYSNDEMLGDDVMPPLPVDKISGKYFIYDRGSFMRGSGRDANGKPKSLRRPKAVAGDVDYALSTDKFYAEEYAQRDLVTDAELQLADNPLQPDIDATMRATETIKMDNELMVAAIVGNIANYPAANTVALTTGANGTSWGSYTSANSNPFLNIKNGKIAVRRGVLKEANTLLLSISTARTLADHPLIKDLTKYTDPEGLTGSGLPKRLRGLDVLEGAQQQCTSPEGVYPQTFSDVWVASDGSDMALIFYRSASVGPRTVHYGRTFEAPDATTGVRGFQARRYRDDEKKGTFVEVSTTRDWKLVSVDTPATGLSVAGYLITSADV